MDTAFSTRACAWSGCGEVFLTASEVWHHVRNVHLVPSELRTFVCLWAPGQRRGNRLVLRLVRRVVVAVAHYKQLFQPFEARVSHHELALPANLTISNGLALFPGYEPMAHDRPQFYPVVFSSNVVRYPGFCPWCVFDQDMDMSGRMHQYLRGDAFVRHLRTHLDELDDRKLNAHLVLQHRLVIFGTTSTAGTTMKLHLLSPSGEPPAVISNTPAPSATLPRRIPGRHHQSSFVLERRLRRTLHIS
ncbi:hypothetical protein B0H13DRAFT_2337886 [Mycena leptocephala]|nr:hypothetical protein B0H13DRAFT_2337886 [Mycena leptocephala]